MKKNEEPDINGNINKGTHYKTKSREGKKEYKYGQKEEYTKRHNQQIILPRLHIPKMHQMKKMKPHNSTKRKKPTKQ